jgi:hypothetical protein
MMTPLSPKILKFSKRAKRTPVTSNVPGRAADPAKQSSRLLRPRTAEDIANEQTAEQLALRIWPMARRVICCGAATCGDGGISSRFSARPQLGRRQRGRSGPRHQ